MTTSNQEYYKASIFERLMRFWMGTLPYCEDCKFCKDARPRNSVKPSLDYVDMYCLLLPDKPDTKYLLARNIVGKVLTCHTARMESGPCKPTGKYFTPKK